MIKPSKKESILIICVTVNTFFMLVRSKASPLQRVPQELRQEGSPNNARYFNSQAQVFYHRLLLVSYLHFIQAFFLYSLFFQNWDHSAAQSAERRSQPRQRLRSTSGLRIAIPYLIRPHLLLQISPILFHLSRVIILFSFLNPVRRLISLPACCI